MKIMRTTVGNIYLPYHYQQCVQTTVGHTVWTTCYIHKIRVGTTHNSTSHHSPTSNYKQQYTCGVLGSLVLCSGLPGHTTPACMYVKVQCCVHMICEFIRDCQFSQEQTSNSNICKINAVNWLKWLHILLTHNSKYDSKINRVQRTIYNSILTFISVVSPAPLLPSNSVPW